MDKYNKAMTLLVFVVQTDPQSPPQSGLAQHSLALEKIIVYYHGTTQYHTVPHGVTTLNSTSAIPERQKKRERLISVRISRLKADSLSTKYMNA